MMHLLPLLFLAQSLGLPAGSLVKIDNGSGGQAIEGTVLAWRRDTLLVQPKGRADTVRVAPADVKKLRILESPALWRYASQSEINFYVSADLPRPHDYSSESGDAYDRLLLVGSKTELAGVSPATGAVVWTRKDLADLKAVALDVIGSTGYAIVTRRDTMEIIDLHTGLRRWGSETLSFSAARGWLPSAALDTAILILGRTAASATTVMAVDIATGRVRWRQDSAFTVEPKVFESGGVSYLFGNQLPFAESDTTFVLYLSTDGPIRLDARTGRVLWRSTALRGGGAKLPLPNDGYAYMAARRGVVVVPSGDSLVALRTSDGTAAWPAAHRFKNRVIRIVPTPKGLLVRGYEWFDLLDPATGRSLWPAPAELKNSTWDVLRGDTVYVAGDKRVVAINLGDGTVRTLATVDFKEREQPTSLAVRKQGIILSSWHNLMLVDRKGMVRYQQDYPSPKLSFGEALRNSAAGSEINRPTTRWVGSFIFFFTGVADDQGREGFSVVEVDPAEGREVGRLWFNERMPWYTFDAVSSIVYYRRDDHTIDAFPLRDGDDLAYAVRNGQAGVVEHLLTMGIDPGTAWKNGWTPLHAAALTGHADVARLLIVHGAKTDAKTPEGWTPWMLAVRERHDSLARELRGGDTDSTSAGAAAATGWRLAHQGQIAEALAAVSRGTARDSTLGLWPWVWRVVCWNGAVSGQAAAVLTACDHAVERTPADDANYDAAHLFRAIARAATGNLEGAATDLEATGASADDNSSTGRWIAALRAGRNPFTPAVVETLRR
jgi:outer membrane protein assembly factor BamB